MNFNDYKRLAMRTFPENMSGREELSMAALGLAGEAGEVVELVKKALYHGHELNLLQIQKELGDVLWYVAALCAVMRLSMDDVAEGNIAKLQARYPEGFSDDASRNRGEK